MPSADQTGTPNDVSESHCTNGNVSASNGVRRQLFPDQVEGNDEIEEIVARQIEEILKRNADEAKARWNFDFKNDTPLQGEWIWEPMNT